MYKALLVAPDGDFVTDFESDTVEDVWDSINNMGSRWYFYPFPLVVNDDDVVVSAAWMFPAEVVGTSVADTSGWVADNGGWLVSLLS